jgi:hypothetical protein
VDIPFPPILPQHELADVYPTVEKAAVYVKSGVGGTLHRYFYADVTICVKEMQGPSEDFYQGFIVAGDHPQQLEWKVQDVYEYIQLPVSMYEKCELEVQDDLATRHIFTSPTDRLLLQF